MQLDGYCFCCCFIKTIDLKKLLYICKKIEKKKKKKKIKIQTKLKFM